MLSFARRDFQARYAQTYLGYAWALLQTGLSLFILYLLFGRMLQVDTGRLDFFSYALSGILWWNFFNTLSQQAASSLVQAQAMMQKIYFPRVLLPLSKALVAGVDLGIGLLIFIIYGLAVGSISVGMMWSFLPTLFILLFSAWGLGLWVAALSIRFRDLQQILPFLLQMLFFLSPIAYRSSLWEQVGSSWMAQLLSYNPVAGALELFRAGCFGSDLSSSWLYGALLAGLIFFSGMMFFRFTERKMADLI